MSDNVYWMLVVKVKPGKASEVKSLMADMVDGSKSSEPGTLIYEWSASEDGASYHMLERFADSAAALTHLKSFGENFAGRFLDVFDVVRFFVFGAPDAAVREAVAGFNPTYLKLERGFARFPG